MFVAGIDGGGTKTHCVVGDGRGAVLSEGLSGGSNYQVIGEAAAGAEIRSALSRALAPLHLAPSALSYTVLGLAGADLPEDFAVLNRVCGAFLPAGRFRILNDTWIGLRAGIPENVGIVTVCGTGGACAGRNAPGREIALRNLTYEAGNRGGGSDILRMALHHAFRSEEMTGAKTRLERELPKLFGLNDMGGMAGMVREMKLGPEKLSAIPVLVGRLATEGDTVCQEILLNVGHALGELAGGVAKRLEMEKSVFQVTLAGSVFRSECPLLLDEYTTTLHRTAPFAKISLANEKPVMGAYYLARETALSEGAG